MCSRTEIILLIKVYVMVPLLSQHILYTIYKSRILPRPMSPQYLRAWKLHDAQAATRKREAELIKSEIEDTNKSHSLTLFLKDDMLASTYALALHKMSICGLDSGTRSMYSTCRPRPVFSRLLEPSYYRSNDISLK